MKACFGKRWIESDAIRRFECGEISPVDFARLFVVEWQLSVSPEEFLHHFAKPDPAVFDRTVHELAATLQELGVLAG